MLLSESSAKIRAQMPAYSISEALGRDLVSLSASIILAQIELVELHRLALVLSMAYAVERIVDDNTFFFRLCP